MATRPASHASMLSSAALPSVHRSRRRASSWRAPRTPSALRAVRSVTSPCSPPGTERHVVPGGGHFLPSRATSGRRARHAQGPRPNEVALTGNCRGVGLGEGPSSGAPERPADEAVVQRAQQGRAQHGSAPRSPRTKTACTPGARTFDNALLSHEPWTKAVRWARAIREKLRWVRKECVSSRARQEGTDGAAA